MASIQGDSRRGARRLAIAASGSPAGADFQFPSRCLRKAGTPPDTGLISRRPSDLPIRRPQRSPRSQAPWASGRS